jgi:hypothetical protein
MVIDTPWQCQCPDLSLSRFARKESASRHVIENFLKISRYKSPLEKLYGH